MRLRIGFERERGRQDQRLRMAPLEVAVDGPQAERRGHRCRVPLDHEPEAVDPQRAQAILARATNGDLLDAENAEGTRRHLI